MSENTVEGESSTPQSTEAVETNIGELLDTDGLASQLERMFDAQTNPLRKVREKTKNRLLLKMSRVVSRREKLKVIFLKLKKNLLRKLNRQMK